VDEWLTGARDALVEAASISPEKLELDDEDASTLLDLARIAAHVSGERTNAPLLCSDRTVKLVAPRLDGDGERCPLRARAFRLFLDPLAFDLERVRDLAVVDDLERVRPRLFEVD
jgi:hypothetical protein